MLTYGEHTLSSEWHTDANITQWCEVLRSFNNVKTLHVPNGLTKGLSGSLAVHDGLGESPMELLPELEELRYDASGSVGWAFEQFLDVRRKGGRPFTLVPIYSLEETPLLGCERYPHLSRFGPFGGGLF